MATLSIVATPIGNLDDITLRALETLRRADLVLCEDTRMTKRLLDRHEIKVATMSYHMHSKLAKVEKIIELLKDGKNLALVSDAGTPGISDPGAELVAKVRAAFSLDGINESSEGIKIESIPGPSALTSALSIAGVPCAEFTFLGFLPHKKGRETLFREIAASERTMVFYESPHRIVKAAESLIEHLAGSPRKVTICRELTKIYEECVSGSAVEVADFLASHPEKVRGELVVIVSQKVATRPNLPL